MAVSSLVSTRTQMDAYVETYKQRYESAKSVYEGKQQLVANAGTNDRNTLMTLRQDASLAKQEMQSAWNDLAEARKYADKQIAKAEKQEADTLKAVAGKNGTKTAEKSLPGKALDGVVSAAGLGVVGVGVAALGAGKLAKAGVKKGKEALDNSRIAMNNTASFISMSFAKYILGYEGTGLPADPSRRSWDPAIKESKKKGYCHDAEHQPSFI